MKCIALYALKKGVQIPQMVYIKAFTASIKVSSYKNTLSIDLI